MKGRKSHHYKKRIPIFKRKIFFFSIFSFLFFYFAFLFLFIFPTFALKKIEIFGTERIKKEKIEILIQPAKNLLFLNSEKLKEKIKKEIPEIESVKIEKKFPDTLRIIIVERKEVFEICSKECYFLDKKGVVFSLAKNPSNLPILEIKGEVKIGQKILEEKILEKIFEVLENLKNLNQIPQKIIIFSKNEIKVLTEENFFIIFDLEKDLKWQFQKLKYTLEKEIPPEKRKNLDYIDLRFEIFVNYKFRQ